MCREFQENNVSYLYYLLHRNTFHLYVYVIAKSIYISANQTVLDLIGCAKSFHSDLRFSFGMHSRASN